MRPALLLLSIFACAQAEAAEPRDSGVASPLESLPQSIWTVDENSVAHHVQTGLACPYTVENFTLESIMTYDEVGFDVSCNYNAPNGVVTIYLTKRGDTPLTGDLERAVYEIDYVYPDAESVDAAMTPQLTSDTLFLTALYHFPDRGAHSGIWIADFSGWTAKFRATYPVDDPSAVVPAMEALLSEAEPARAHLANCSAIIEPERNGALLQAEEELMTAVLAADLTFTPGPHGENAPIAPDAVWCANAAASVDNKFFVHWYNAAAGAHGAFERITPTGDTSWSIVSYRNEATEQVRTEEGLAAGAIYDVALHTGNDASLRSVYHGLPPLEQLVAIAATERRFILANFNPETGQITVFRFPPPGAIPAPE